MTRPFFTIILPSKDRPEYLRQSMRHVLAQSERDLELLVIDNGDQPAKDVVDGFDDDRIRYVRTGGLSMPDNWERGWQLATGEYTINIGDRLVFRAGALRLLRRALDDNPVECVSWPIGCISERGIEPSASRAACYLESPDDVIKRWISAEVWMLETGNINCVPRGYNSATKRSLRERMLANGRACWPVSPDLMLAFHQLALTESLMRLDLPIVADLVTGPSNGGSVRMGKAKDFFARIGPGLDWRVPVRLPTLLTSLTDNDYVLARERFGERLQNHEMDWTAHFVRTQRELAQTCALLPVATVAPMVNEWARALAGAVSRGEVDWKEIRARALRTSARSFINVLWRLTVPKAPPSPPPASDAAFEWLRSGRLLSMELV